MDSITRPAKKRAAKKRAAKRRPALTKPDAVELTQPKDLIAKTIEDFENEIKRLTEARDALAAL